MQLRMSPNVKQLYESWLKQQGFKARIGQKQMMSFIDSVINSPDSKIGVVEAPTGIGKSIAYSATVLPLAKALDRKVILVTATVALQEQLQKDVLPSIAKASEQHYSFVVLKGRRRYVCTNRLKKIVRPNTGGSMKAMLDGGNSDIANLNQLLDQLDEHVWDGDLDYSPVKLNDSLKFRITTDSRGCAREQCPDYRECPYFTTITKSRKADVVLTNYDHLLSNLRVENNIFPAFDRAIVIFDESQNLAAKVQTAFSLQCNLLTLAETLQATLGTMTVSLQKVNLNPGYDIEWELLSSSRQSAVFALKNLNSLIVELDFRQDDAERDQSIHRFVDGLISNELSEQMLQLLISLENIRDQLIKCYGALLATQEDTAASDLPTKFVELLDSVAQVLSQLEEAVSLLHCYAESAEEYAPARWIEKSNTEESRYVLRSVPIETGSLASKYLWEHIDRAILTSATIDANDNFQHFLLTVGLNHSSFVDTLVVDTPFDLTNCVSLQLPKFKYEPKAKVREQFVAELANKLPAFLRQNQSALVLFTSWSMLLELLDKLSPTVRKHCFTQQRDGGIPLLLEEHKQRIDAGMKSYLFGTNALREGVDLPGDYCQHVIITKLPFEVFTDPVYYSRHEHLQAAGLSAREIFETLQTASTILKLKQACGRLIRTKTDRGLITICDRRIQGQFKGMLNALPYQT